MNRLSSTTGLCRGISLSLPAGMRSSGRKGLWDWVGRCGNSIHQRDLYHLIFEWTRNTHWTPPPTPSLLPYPWAGHDVYSSLWLIPTDMAGRVQSLWTTRQPLSPRIVEGFPKHNFFGCFNLPLSFYFHTHPHDWGIANSCLLSSPCSQHTSPRCLPQWKPDPFRAHLSLAVLLRCLTICTHSLAVNCGFLASPLKTPGFISFLFFLN